MVRTMGWMRAFGLVFAVSGLAAAGFALSASSSNTLAPTCSATDKTSQILVAIDGYSVACGPGSAVVRANGARYRIAGTRCFVGAAGARLYFGAFRFGLTPVVAPQNSLMLVLGPYRQAGENVIDGGVKLVNGVTGLTFTGAISGKARAAGPGLRRGTFTISGRSDNVSGKRFTGTWRCG